jgi:hypothetical protein
MERKKRRKAAMFVDQKTKIDVSSVLIDAIEKYGVKRLLHTMGYFAAMENIHYTTTTAAVFADKKKIENSIGGQVILYVLANWDEISKKAQSFVSAKLNA